MLERLNPEKFTYELWYNYPYKFSNEPLAGRLLKERFRRNIRETAIGYCFADELSFRPKDGCVAVMCFEDGNQYWVHLTSKEFYKVFGETIWEE